VIVVDASAAMAGLFNDGPARQALGAEHLHAPHLVDSEVASGLRRRVAAGQLSAANILATLHAWRRLAVTCYAIHALLDRVWELRHSLSVYDAGHVALAELLNCGLVTADARLSRAAGVRCPITVVPR
jgi:predicted nucleic acid-binding protein